MSVIVGISLVPGKILVFENPWVKMISVKTPGVPGGAKGDGAA